MLSPPHAKPWISIGGIIIFLLLLYGYGISRACTRVQHPVVQLLASSLNPSANYRAAAVKHYPLWGSANTLIYVTPGSAEPPGITRADMPLSATAMILSQCGPVQLRWSDARTLHIICDHCSRTLQEASRHMDAIGPVRILYEGFPRRSAETQTIAVENRKGTWKAMLIQTAVKNDSVADQAVVTVQKKDHQLVPQDVFALRKSGPLRLRWVDDYTLAITCKQCGRSLHDAMEKADNLGPVRILYENFPP